MNTFYDYAVPRLSCGRIGEICDLTEEYYGCPPAELKPETLLQILCTVMKITPEDLDAVISGQP